MGRKPALPTYLCFDVESIGLYGEGFAVGFVHIEESGSVLSHGFFGTDPANAEGFGAAAEDDRRWVSTHVRPAITRAWNCEDTTEVRSKFFDEMRKALKSGAQLWGDSVYPVETTFLRRALEDRVGEKLDPAGSPLLRDVAPVALLLGLEECKSRVPHDPVEDARASASTLLVALAMIRSFENR